MYLKSCLPTPSLPPLLSILPPLLGAASRQCVPQCRGDYGWEWQARRLIPYPLWITDQLFLNDSLNTCCRLRVFTGSYFIVITLVAYFVRKISVGAYLNEVQWKPIDTPVCLLLCHFGERKTPVSLNFSLTHTTPCQYYWLLRGIKSERGKKD